MEHLEKLDGHIQPGIVKYDWKSGGCDPFVEFCCKECNSVYAKIKIFQQRKGEIDAEIDKISNNNLTEIFKKLYDINTFINTQEVTLRKYTQEYKDSLDFIHPENLGTLRWRSRQEIQGSFEELSQKLFLRLAEAHQD
jgi:hypothetical protein